MDIASLSGISGIDTEQRALERLLQERAQREQARLAQLDTDEETERVRLSATREQQRFDALRAQAGDERQRDQGAFSSRASSQRDTELRQADRLTAQRILGGELAAQHLIEERVRIEAPNAYRAQTTPPPASSLTDQLA